MTSRITIDPEIQHGKPIITGTRVPIIRILGGLAGGMSINEISEEYAVTEEDVQAALLFAQDLVEQEEFHPFP